MTPNTRGYCKLLVAVMLVAACPQKTAIWIANGSTTQHLEFIVGKKRGKEEPVRFYAVIVSRCERSDSEAEPFIWSIWETPAAISQYPTRVLYGHVPTGFEEKDTAMALTVGCYQASTIGSGAISFKVDSLGKIDELEK